MLPEIAQSGAYGDLEPFPIFEIDFDSAEEFLEFEDIDRNMTTIAEKLTSEFVGLHEVNITVTD